MSHRTFWKCNIPTFLLVIVLLYWYFTIFTVGDWAITRSIEQAHDKLFPKRRRAIPPPKVSNGFSDLWTFIFGEFWLFSLLGDVPIALILGGLTLVSLYTAALGDPGAVPSDYVHPTSSQQQSAMASGQRTDPTGGGAAIAVPSDTDGFGPQKGSGGSSGDVDVQCAPAKAVQNRSLFRSSQQSNSRLAPRNQAARSTPNYCDLCRTDRPDRSHHCRYCQECYVRYDHHCDWIDNCVGVRNHKCFVLFIVYIFVCILHYLTMFGRFFQGNIINSSVNDLGGVFHVVLIVLYTFTILPCGIFALFFLVNTVYQLLIDETTIESTHYHYKRVKKYASSAAPAGPQPSCLRKAYSNVASVMGSNPLAWWIPTLQPLVIPPQMVASSQPPDTLLVEPPVVGNRYHSRPQAEGPRTV